MKYGLKLIRFGLGLFVGCAMLTSRSFAAEVDPTVTLKSIVDFIELYNGGDFARIPTATLLKPKENIFENIYKNFGKIEIKGEVKQIKYTDLNKACEEAVAKGNTVSCVRVDISGEYFDNQSNGVMKDYFEIESEFAGKGYMQVFQPGDEKKKETTDAKIAAVTFIFGEKDNFAGWVKYMSHVKDISAAQPSAVAKDGLKK